MDIDPDDPEDEPLPRSPDEIEFYELQDGLLSLAFMDEPYLRMQITNLAATDMVLMPLESQVLYRLIDEERTPIDDAMVLNGFSQMWLFAAYELLRTWRQRVRDIEKWLKNGGIDQKIAALEGKGPRFHPARDFRIAQLNKANADPTTSSVIATDLRRVHILYGRLELLRIALAKHEIAGKKNSIAHSPGYARIHRFTGSLEYQLSGDFAIVDSITRRDVADEIRALAAKEAPSDEALKGFDAMMEAVNEPPPDFD